MKALERKRKAAEAELEKEQKAKEKQKKPKKSEKKLVKDTPERSLLSKCSQLEARAPAAMSHSILKAVAKSVHNASAITVGCSGKTENKHWFQASGTW